MNFRTEITINEPFGRIDHTDKVWTIGSCFSDSIGDKLLAEGFSVEVNPLGTLYNPLSILNSVSNLVRNRRYLPQHFFEFEGKFRSYDFHSIFSRSTAEAAADFANSRLDELRSQLPELTTVILTFGSARCFKLKSTGQAVANCHKQHPNLFAVEDISVELCLEAMSETVSLLQRVCPKLRQIILTVSPIRHKAYGLHTDKLSKATLLLACDKLRRLQPQLITYFPSYEIMMDDLRDYRFYAADMVHPSDVAVDYIYEKFGDAFFSDATRQTAAANLRNFRRSLHRPR
jgi:hypothetical protein